MKCPKGVKYRNGRRLAPPIRVPEDELRWAVMCGYAMRRRNVLSRTDRGVVGTCDHCGKDRLVELTDVSSESSRTGVFRLADLLIHGLPATSGLWCKSCRHQTPSAIRRRRTQAKRTSTKRARRDALAGGSKVSREEAAVWAHELIERENAKRRSARAPSTQTADTKVAAPNPTGTSASTGYRFDLGIVALRPRVEIERDASGVMRGRRVGWNFKMDDGTTWALLDTVRPYQKPIPLLARAA
jgi:hypothetical protein